MAESYANIRKALEMGPTPGPWEVWDDVIYDDNDNFHVLRHFVTAHEADVVGAYGVESDRPSANADAALIAACDPDTLRELLAERDALARDAERYRWLRENERDRTDVFLACCRDELDSAIDAAIAAANGGGNG